MKPTPDLNVVEWLNESEGAHYLSAITVSEISFGLQSLRKSKKRARLENGFSLLLEQGFQNRVLPFDELAALQYGQLMAKRRSGNPMSTFDGQVAAIAQVHDCILVTRNVRDFKYSVLEILNPFIEIS